MEKDRIMRSSISKQKRIEIATLGIFSLLCFLLSLIRILYTDQLVFLFLNWNLFLAFIPWLITSIIIYNIQLIKKRWLALILLFVWILFFPNAPYILTDLLHIRHTSSTLFWYDLVLILSFAWTGLLFGMLSLRDLESILLINLNKNQAVLFTSVFLFLAGFGIYAGRFLRWNSWDVLMSPNLIGNDLMNIVFRPLEHWGIWGMTFLMGIFLNMIYWSFRLILNKKQPL